LRLEIGGGEQMRHQRRRVHRRLDLGHDDEAAWGFSWSRLVAGGPSTIGKLFFCCIWAANLAPATLGPGYLERQAASINDLRRSSIL